MKIWRLEILLGILLLFGICSSVFSEVSSNVKFSATDNKAIDTITSTELGIYFASIGTDSYGDFANFSNGEAYSIMEFSDKSLLLNTFESQSFCIEATIRIDNLTAPSHVGILSAGSTDGLFVYFQKMNNDYQEAINSGSFYITGTNFDNKWEASYLYDVHKPHQYKWCNDKASSRIMYFQDGIVIKDVSNNGYFPSNEHIRSYSTFLGIYYHKSDEPGNYFMYSFSVQDFDQSTCKNLDFCNFNGICIDGVCNCTTGFFGEDCSLSKCNGMLSNDPDVCSSFGDCVNETCICNDGYYGSQCELWNCNNTPKNYLTSCTIFGLCISPDRCSFVVLYFIIIAGTLVCFSLIILILFFSVTIIATRKKKITSSKFKNEELKDYISEEESGAYSFSTESPKESFGKESKSFNSSELSLNTSFQNHSFDESSFSEQLENLEEKYKKLRIEKDCLSIQNNLLLGVGGFSIVKKGEIKVGISSIKVAIKIIQQNEEKNLHEICKEVEIMHKLQHKHIIKCFGFYVEERDIGIVTEYHANGDLSKWLQSRDLNQFNRFKILLKVARGMKYLHDQNYLHRDLKTSNILINNALEPVIIDFGCSSSLNSASQSFVGSLVSIAPEIISGERNHSKESDVYSFSMVCYEVLTKEVPFSTYKSKENSQFSLMKKISRQNLRPPVESLIKEKIPEFIINLIIQCWSKNVEDRFGFEKIILLLKKAIRMYKK